MRGIPWKGLAGLIGLGTLSLALAQNPTQGPPEGFLDAVFNVIFPSSIADTAKEWQLHISRLISVGVSNIARALLLLAFLYRIYDLWLSEVSSSSFIYTIVRYAFIFGFFSISNYYLAHGEVNAPLTGVAPGVPIDCRKLIFSSVAVCAWQNGLNGGLTRMQGMQGRLEQAIDRFVKATITAIAGLSLVKLFKAGINSALKYIKPRPKTGTPPPPPSPDGQVVKGETPSLISTLLRSMNVLPFLAYLLLALPAIIYAFLVVVSSVSLTIAAVFIPLAIALLAWGQVQPVFRVGLFILAQILFVYVLPTVFMLSVIFALERPATMMQGMSTQINAAMDTIIEQLTASTVSFDDANEQLVQNRNLSLDLVEYALGKAREMLENTLQALFSIIGSMLMIIVLLILAFLFFIASLLISFAAAFALINAVPALLINILQTGGDGVRPPTPGMGTGPLSGPAKIRLR